MKPPSVSFSATSSVYPRIGYETVLNKCYHSTMSPALETPRAAGARAWWGAGWLQEPPVRVWSDAIFATFLLAVTCVCVC